MVYRKKVRVYFDQGDPANITFHGEHPVIAQRVFEEYLVEKCKIPWDDWFRNPDLSMPVVKLHTDYLKPLHPGREYFVEARLTRIGTSSLHCEYKILNLKEEKCCFISAAYVCVDQKTFKSRPLPKDWLAILKEHVED